MRHGSARLRPSDGGPRAPRAAPAAVRYGSPRSAVITINVSLMISRSPPHAPRTAIRDMIVELEIRLAQAVESDLAAPLRCPQPRSGGYALLERQPGPHRSLSHTVRCFHAQMETASHRRRKLPAFSLWRRDRTDAGGARPDVRQMARPARRPRSAGYALTHEIMFRPVAIPAGAFSRSCSPGRPLRRSSRHFGHWISSRARRGTLRADQTDPDAPPWRRYRDDRRLNSPLHP